MISMITQYPVILLIYHDSSPISILIFPGSRSPAPPPNPRPVQQQGNNNNRRIQQKPAKKVQRKPRVQKPKVKKDPWPQVNVGFRDV